MVDETAIDIETFISLVEERPMLWDKYMHLYKNRQATQTAWDEITMAINPTLETALEKQAFEILLRKKWRYLRDQFSIELAKLKTSSDGTYVPKWPHFSSLMFLESVVHLRKFRTSKKDRSSFWRASVEHIDDSVDVAHTSCQSDDDIYDPLEDNDDEKPPKKKSKYSTNNISKYNTRQEECNQKRSREDENAEHMYFFKSLLPHVQEIPRQHLLSFRSRVQEIVQEFAYNPANHSDLNSN